MSAQATEQPVLPAVVEIGDLAVRFGSRWALGGVGLGAHGGVTALLGPNGAGKTTLLRCLATVIEPQHGWIRVDGLDPRIEQQRIEIRRRLGYQPQRPEFSPNARVFDAVDLLAVAKEIAPERLRRAEVSRVLGVVGLRERATDRVRSLSGGMRARLGIAQALLGDPAMLLLDEPEAGLDPEQRLALRSVLSSLGERGTVIISTHQLSEAVAIAATMYVLDQGRIVFSGDAAALAGVARGRVWISPDPPPDSIYGDLGIRASWRLPEGGYRIIGEPPPGAQLTEPTAEDGYLLLVGAQAATI